MTKAIELKTIKVTLARALRIKNSVVEKIKRMELGVRSNNSVIAGNEREVDIAQEIQNRQVLVRALTRLKLALQEATRPIQGLIFEVAETKAEITFLQTISTVHGQQASHYGTESAKYEAILRKSDIDKCVEELQSRIDVLQSKIDAHNNAVFMEIELPSTYQIAQV